MSSVASPRSDPQDYQPMEPITGFATAIAILKNLNDLMASAGESVPREVLDQVRALQTELLAAQQREIDLTERCRKLEDELSRVDDWETVKTLYVPYRMSGGATVYALKPEHQGDDEAPQLLCANCFQDRRMSHLQPQEPTALNRTPWKCPRCEATLVIWRKRQTKQTSKRTARR